MSDSFANSFIGFTSNPSITASIALIGSISETETIAPRPFALAAIPLPTHPYPHTVTFLPAINNAVDLKIPSKVL